MAPPDRERIALTDTSVLLNLAIVDRLELLGALPKLEFLVPEEVVEEVIRPRQRALLEQALERGDLSEIQLTGIEPLNQYRDLRRKLGPGESACLALAHENGWMVASDEKGWFRSEARRLLGNDRLINTPGLFLLAIRQGYWSIEDADRAKETLEANRYRMRFASFHDLMRFIER